MKLSVAMIVKNEQDMLARCLESVKEADEIVVCDTGSEDDTVKIAKQYTDLVYEDFKWCDDFGKARQHVKEKCTGDWVLSIDADEVLNCSIEHVKEVIEEAEREGRKFVNVHVTAETGNGENLFPRIYKNIPEITWGGAAHNYLRLSGESVGITSGYNSDIIVYYGYSPAHKKDPDRTLRILKKAVEDNSDLVRERYYLGREYFSKHRWDEAIEALDEYIKRSKFLAERNDAWVLKAYCWANKKEYEKACDCAWQALKYNANFKEALTVIATYMDPINKERWHSFAQLADNRNVLFVREVHDVKQDEKGAEYYDSLFEKNDDMSRYEEIYKEVRKIVGDKRVLDIGCGLAELSKYLKNYRGFDIAKKTIEKKRSEGLDVWEGNALEKESYKAADYYILLEVLEHIQKDREVLESFSEGQKIVFLVPSFDDPSHVRYFDENFLKERYGEIVDIKRVVYFVWDSGRKRWYKSDKLRKPFILLVEAVRL
jgi:glycosyltransferase involved in cell wall biosynthesis